MNIPGNEVVVLDIAGTLAKVSCADPKVKAQLSALGFVDEVSMQMARRISDDIDRRGLVLELVKLGALFSGGRDWSPAELMDHYREQGVIAGRYRVITWTSPTQYVVAERG